MGTELLLGQIANTNAQTISSRLATIGVDVFFHTVVGDNVERAASTISHALDRSDVVILTGGLGPTPDDVTRDAVAQCLGLRLIRDPALVDVIRGIFAALDRPMPEENLKQADLPEGATPIPPEGTAPGFYVDSERGLVAAVPGVPWEMRAMLDKVVIPLLADRGDGGATISRQVLVVGLGESLTHAKIADIVDDQTNPTIAYLAGGGQVRVRITAKAESESAARALIAPVEMEIRERLGEAAVEGDHATLADALGSLLRARNATAAVAESLTGGLIAARLTSAPGASDFFVGSLVCYSDDAKRDAGVPEAVLAGAGAISADCAAALAEGAAAKLRTDLGLGTTGVAGPDPAGGHPVGTIFVAAAYGDRTETRRITGYGDRTNIREIAVTAALDLGRRLLLAT